MGVRHVWVCATMSVLSCVHEREWRSFWRDIHSHSHMYMGSSSVLVLIGSHSLCNSFVVNQFLFFTPNGENSLCYTPKKQWEQYGWKKMFCLFFTSTRGTLTDKNQHMTHSQNLNWANGLMFAPTKRKPLIMLCISILFYCVVHSINKYIW